MFLHFREIEEHNWKVNDASLRNHLMMDNPILNQYRVQSEGGNLLNQDDDISLTENIAHYMEIMRRKEYAAIFAFSVISAIFSRSK